MNNLEAAQWLDEVWGRVLESGATNPNAKIDRLVNSKVLSIRYAILTQILGKIANMDRGLLSLQVGEGGTPAAWDPRSFCSSVIVPWVADNHDVLGKSPDPYVNNPLRRPRLDEGMQQLRLQEEWEALVSFLSPLDEVPKPDLEDAFVRCLESAARRLTNQSFEYQVPLRVSLPATLRIMESFLADASGGLRPLAVATAMMIVCGRAFSIFESVSSQGLNEADSSSGVPGDVMCFDNSGSLVMVVEVKDRFLTVADVRSSTGKARTSTEPFSSLLFATPGIQGDERGEIRHNMETAWASGLNINQIDIVDLANAVFALLPEGWRPKILREIGVELDRRADHTHRHAWHELLLELN